MFVSVDNDRAYIVRTLGVDNGSEYLGVAVNDHDLRTGVSNIIFAHTYRPSRVAYDKYPHLCTARTPFAARVRSVCDIITEVLDVWDPDVFGCESPFSHLHVHSYASLLTTFNAIDDAAYAYRSTLPFIRVPPGKAKKTACMGFKYSTEKSHIRSCILNTLTILGSDDVILEKLDEDAIDAVAVSRHVALLYSD